MLQNLRKLISVVKHLLKRCLMMKVMRLVRIYHLIVITAPNQILIFILIKISKIKDPTIKIKRIKKRYKIFLVSLIRSKILMLLYCYPSRKQKNQIFNQEIYLQKQIPHNLTKLKTNFNKNKFLNKEKTLKKKKNTKLLNKIKRINKFWNQICNIYQTPKWHLKLIKKDKILEIFQIKSKMNIVLGIHSWDPAKRRFE